MLKAFVSPLSDYCFHASSLRNISVRSDHRLALREVFARLPFVVKLAVLLGISIFVVGACAIVRKSIRRLTLDEYVKVDSTLTGLRLFEKSQAALRVFAVLVVFSEGRA